jgi:hypothetical protein
VYISLSNSTVPVHLILSLNAETCFGHASHGHENKVSLKNFQLQKCLTFSCEKRIQAMSVLLSSDNNFVAFFCQYSV